MSSGLEWALKMRRVHRLFVFGADAEALSRELAQITGLRVRLIDLRGTATPPLSDRVLDIAEQGEIAMIAIDASPPQEFAPLLSELLHQLRWGELRDWEAKVSIVVCTTAKELTQIKGWEALQDVRGRLMYVPADAHNSPIGLTDEATVRSSSDP